MNDFVAPAVLMAGNFAIASARLFQAKTRLATYISNTWRVALALVCRWMESELPTYDTRNQALAVYG